MGEDLQWGKVCNGFSVPLQIFRGEGLQYNTGKYNAQISRAVVTLIKTIVFESGILKTRSATWTDDHNIENILRSSEKGRDLTQSYEKSPYVHPQKNPKSIVTT